MKRLAIALCLLSVPAFAQSVPKTIEIPIELANWMRQYLGNRPYDEVAQGIDSLMACSTIQIPKDGLIQDRGQCPVVSAARRDRDAKMSELESEIAKMKAATSHTGDPK